MSLNNETTYADEALPRGTVLIAGGGPIGLLLATILAHYGIKSVLLERNKTTTRWPKMDLTNARSMEILRRLGLADSWRAYGVPSHIPQPVLISSGLASKEAITQWSLPSVDEFRARINSHNDGSQPLEPWQRGSQVLFEKWLKGICDSSAFIDVRFGWKVESVEEREGLVRTLASNVDSGATVSLTSDYVAGCDGASSKVRSSLSMPLDGGPIPACVLLIHFKSLDLTRLQKQGQFWHIFFLVEPGEFGGVIIAQNEVDIWTTHLFLPVDADTDNIASEDAVYTVLGGLDGKFPIKIDEILVRSTWRPNIAVTRTWAGTHGRVFLAGDSAHQSIPTGGYGMNMGIADAYDLGWKLAAVISGYAGRKLLDSYETERRPVALRNVEHSGVHMDVHFAVKEILAGGDPHRIDGETEAAKDIRRKIHEHYQAHPGENTDFGVEMGYRYDSNVIFKDKDGTREPEWKASEYTPTTWPGGRPPHVFLSDGSAVFDKFGKDWTLITFTVQDSGYQYVMEAAKSLSLPLKHVDLSGEVITRKLWERDIVLIRPDEHVAWRSNKVENLADAKYVLEYVTGLGSAVDEAENRESAHKPEEAFSATVELTTQTGEFELDKMGDFQK